MCATQLARRGHADTGVSTTDQILAVLHILAAFCYVAGLVAVQLPLVKAWHGSEGKARLEAFEEAQYYQGALLVPGAIATIGTGVALWANVGYGLVSAAWLIAVEAMYIFTLLVCLPVIGTGIRRARVAALQAQRRGEATPEQEAVMSEGVPLLFGGIATLLLPAIVALEVFGPL
jgi:uncharacterized membrane protein